MSAQLSGSKYIPNVVQPSPLCFSRTFSPSKTKTLYPLNNNSFFLLLLVPLYTFCLWIFSFLVPYISGIRQYLSFCIWLILFSMFSKFTHVIAYIRISILFKVRQYSIVCMYCILSIHSPVDGHFGCFHLWAIVTKAAKNINVKIDVWVSVF